MTGKEKKHMGLLFVLLGGIFLFDPTVGFLDILPDCVGYLLISVGLLKLSDLNEHIAESAQRFRVMFIVGVGQLFCTYLIYVTMRERAAEMNQYEQPVTILLCSFVLLVFQWYFLIPALRQLFLGLDRLTEQHAGTAWSAQNGKRTAGERLARLSTAFVIVSSVASVLPELTILTSFENDAKNQLFPFDWYDFIALFRMAGALIGIVIGVIWLVSYLKYFGKALADEELLNALRTRYVAEILPQTGMLTSRRFSLAFLLFNIATVFTVNLRFSAYVALPGIGAAVLIYLALRHLGELVPDGGKHCRISCVALALSSVAHLAANISYLSKFLPESSLYYQDAYRHFLVMRILGAIEAVCTLILIATLLQTMYALVKEHTSEDYAGENTAMISALATERLHKEFERKLILIFVIFALAAVANVLDALLQLEIPWIWLIGFALSFGGIWNFSSMLHELSVHIRNRYH